MINFDYINNSSWAIPSIKGCWSTKNGEIVGNWFILDIEASIGGIIPNPNKEISLGSPYAKWTKLWLKRSEKNSQIDGEIECEGSLSIKSVSKTDDEGNIILTPGELGCIKTPNISIDDKSSLYSNETFLGTIPSIIGGRRIETITAYGSMLCLDVSSEIEHVGGIPLQGIIGPTPNRSGFTDLGAPLMRWGSIYYFGNLDGGLEGVLNVP